MRVSFGLWGAGLAVGLGGGYRDTEQFGPLLIEPSGNRINESWSLPDLDMDLDVTSGGIP